MPQTIARSAIESLADDDIYLMTQLRGEVAGLVASGLSITEAAELVGIRVPNRLPADPPFMPTPAMIRRHCSAIQTTWTATEWRSREASGGGGPVEIHTVRVRDFGDV